MGFSSPRRHNNSSGGGGGGGYFFQSLASAPGMSAGTVM